MSLAAGTRLGVYEVSSLVGCGGMGEVYRARDTKLNRDVALKILPAAFTSDAERVARFRREAQVLAALNHPNIAAIYGLEESGGAQALVLEFVDGPTLADRIASSPLPQAEALAIAKQIAEALETAHEQGIVHRDLKPPNIKVKDDGQVKVLDFGLARLAERAADTTSASSPMSSPTVTSPAHMTGLGVILGTAAYMSPEQARGRTVDKRADIWAFGVVLFEMLSGRRPFEGETISDVLAKVIEREPDWAALPAETPARLTDLIRRCLRKDPKVRLRDIGDARVQVDELMSAPDAPAEAAVPQRRRKLAAAIASTVLTTAAIAAGILWLAMRTAPFAPRPVVRFTIDTPVDTPLGAQLALTPDGQTLVYVVLVGPGPIQPQPMVRRFDQLEATPLAGARGGRIPFISADGKSVGFFNEREIQTVPITGGVAKTVCTYSGVARGATWGPDGNIIFSTSDPDSGLLSVPASGGEPKILTRPDRSRGESDHVLPSLLPDGKAVVFTITGRPPAATTHIAVLDLSTGRQKTVVETGSHAFYVDSGHLVYSDAAGLMAVPFDLDRREVAATATPVRVVEGMLSTLNVLSPFAVSLHGTLVYARLTAGVAGYGVARTLVWVDRQGREDPINLPTRSYTYPRLSPIDGTKVALDIRDQDSDIWIADLARPSLTRLTTDPGSDFYPLWTPDGQHIVFHSNRASIGDLFRQRADGTGPIDRLTTTTDGPHYPYSISHDGTKLIYQDHPLDRGIGLGLLTLTSPAAQSGGLGATMAPLMGGAFLPANAEISPDGHWLVYQSAESGDEEIFVRPFPGVDGGRWPISVGGGTRPAWSPDGHELFYLDAGGFLTAVRVQTTPTFSASTPSRLLNTRYFAGYGGTGLAVAGRTYDVSHDGKRFLMIKDTSLPAAATSSGLTVVLNWSQQLAARGPVK